MKRKNVTALLLALLLLVSGQALAAGVRRTSGFTAKTLDYLPDKARQRTDTLVIGVSDLYGQINPFFAETTGDAYVASLLFDEMVFISNDGTVSGGVTEMEETLTAPEEVWLRQEEMDNTRTVFTFTVRENVRYLDGAPVTSDDFINALYLLLLPGYDGVYDITGLNIVGVQEYYNGARSTIEGIERVSERAFCVSLTGKNASAMALLAVPALRVSVAGDMKRPEGMLYDDYDAFYKKAVSLAKAADVPAMSYGQYALKTLEPGEGASFEANAAYWRGAPKIPNLELRVIKAGRELEAMLAGDVDIISMLGSVESIDSVWDYEKGFINLYTWDGGAVGYLGMNLQSPLFSDARVRQALACGCDRENIIANTIDRYGKVSTMMTFDEFGVNCDVLGEKYPFDAERAAQLLDAAGWMRGADGIRARDGVRFAFTFRYAAPNPVMEKAAPMLAANYRELGMEVEVIPTPLDELLEKVEQNDCDFYFLARRLPQRAAAAMDLFAGDSYLNASGYQSEALDRFLAWACGEGDAARQTVMMEAFFEQLYLELPVIPLYQRSEVLLVSARILNCTVTPAHEITSDVYRYMLTDTLSKQW